MRFRSELEELAEQHGRVAAHAAALANLERQLAHRVERYVLLPNPGLLENLPRRQALIDIILLHLHLQLWYGIICGVMFIDPRRKEIAKVLRDLNFVSIPSQHFFIDTTKAVTSEVR